MLIQNAFSIFLLLPLLIPHISTALHHRISASFGSNKHWHARMPEKTDDALLQAWQELLALQTNQSAVARRDHPIDDRLLTPLHKCASFPFHAARVEDNDDYDNANVVRMRSSASASTLAPQWVEIYGEIGALTSVCAEERAATRTTMDVKELAEEFRNKCTTGWQMPSSSASDSVVPLSLVQMFNSIGARVEAVHGDEPSAHRNLQAWTRAVVDKMRTLRAYATRWKLLLIAPGLHGEHQKRIYGIPAAALVQDVLQSVQLVRHGLPRRTFLLILRQSNLSFWRSVAKTAAFCSKMLSLWELGRAEDDETAWDVLEARLRAVYGDDEEFHVQVVDILERARPVITTSNFANISPLASDCVHLSPRGLSLLHLQLWNWLMQPRLRHVHPFVPLLRPPLCPRPHCPFLATARNSISCPRLPLLMPQSIDANQKATFPLNVSVMLSPFSVLLGFSFSFPLLLSLVAMCSVIRHRKCFSIGDNCRGAEVIAL
uniref:Membrane-associated protein n=1 Tax=Globodera rostochiensis TaxID=31243 RepID=A0A914HW51_GLORO